MIPNLRHYIFLHQNMTEIDEVYHRNNAIESIFDFLLEFQILHEMLKPELLPFGPPEQKEWRRALRTMK